MLYTKFEASKYSMRIIVLTLLWFFCGFHAVAQYPKCIVQFTDKNNSPFTLNAPLSYLSQKAIDRRSKQHIGIDSSDLPVNPLYIQQVLAAGDVTYFSQARWLNQILVYCTNDATINAIAKLPFVKNIYRAGPLRAVHQKNLNETTYLLTGNAVSQLTNTDTLNYGDSYNQVHIHNGEYLHNKGFTGKGITIAMLDAGFYNYKKLRAFDSIRLEKRVLGELDFVNNDSSVTEDNVHGMYCLSTIAAYIPGTMVGTAPDASFWLMRTENVFSESVVEEHNWVAAASFADSAGADMISSSLGYFYFDDPSFNHSYADFYNNSTIVSKGAAMAANKGMIVTNSAGNEGSSDWKYLLFPADADSVCAVGAVDNDGTIASFSSYGYPGKVKPNIVSVGAGTVIYGTDDQLLRGSGTSFSNPNINGLIACLWQAFPGYSNMTILNAVYASADKYSNPDNQYGYGIPDMKAAYITLKTRQNKELYGANWLFATPNPFTNRIAIKVIAQNEGSASLSLLDKDGNTIQTFILTTDTQEIYDTAFNNLDNLPAGDYTVKYNDNTTIKTITVTKQGFQLFNDWIVAAPVPFTNQFTVYFKAPETGKITLRLIDAAGHTIQSKMLNVVLNAYYGIPFQSVASIAKGVYFMQYKGTRKKTLKLLKQ